MEVISRQSGPALSFQVYMITILLQVESQGTGNFFSQETNQTEYFKHESPVIADYDCVRIPCLRECIKRKRRLSE